MYCWNCVCCCSLRPWPAEAACDCATKGRQGAAVSGHGSVTPRAELSPAGRQSGETVGKTKGWTTYVEPAPDGRDSAGDRSPGRAGAGCPGPRSRRLSTPRAGYWHCAVLRHASKGARPRQSEGRVGAAAPRTFPEQFGSFLSQRMSPATASPCTPAALWAPRSERPACDKMDIPTRPRQRIAIRGLNPHVTGAVIRSPSEPPNFICHSSGQLLQAVLAQPRLPMAGYLIGSGASQTGRAHRLDAAAVRGEARLEVRRGPPCSSNPDGRPE